MLFICNFSSVLKQTAFLFVCKALTITTATASVLFHSCCAPFRVRTFGSVRFGRMLKNVKKTDVEGRRRQENELNATELM